MLHREKIHFAESALFYQSITVDCGEKTLQCRIFLIKLPGIRVHNRQARA